MFLHDSDRFKSTDHNAGTSLFWHQNGRVLQQVAAMWCLAFFLERFQPSAASSSPLASLPEQWSQLMDANPSVDSSPVC